MNSPLTLYDRARELTPKVVEVRRTLHAHPELSFAEQQTARYIGTLLEEAGIAYQTIAGTGVLAKIEGIDRLNRCVVLRADMDALPINEETGLTFSSQCDGVMHACGHDMHTAALMGAMLLLNEQRTTWSGTLFGLFQPGEELCPGGASLVLAEDPFAQYEVVAVIGEHVDPELSLGEVGLRSGQYMASSDELRITLHGTGGHGALPHTLTDPVVAAAALITALQQITSRNAPGIIPTVLSIGKVIANGATNIIPSEVYLEGTLRTMDEEWRKRAKERIAEITHGTCAAYGIRADLDIADGYPCVVNDASLTDSARVLFSELWGATHVVALERRMTAEDFGYYAEHYPSLFFRLGTARSDGSPTGRLHTPTFNPDEKALTVGMTSLASLALQQLAVEKVSSKK